MIVGTITFSAVDPEKAIACVREALVMIELGARYCEKYPVNNMISISEKEYLHVNAEFVPDAPTTTA